MIAVLGLVAGVVAGLVVRPVVPGVVEPYLPIAVVAAMDAVFGGLRAMLDGIFDDKVFVVSFLSNVVVAALIVGAAMLMRVETSFRIFGYPGLAMILFLLAAAAGLVLMFSILFYDEKRRKKH